MGSANSSITSFEGDFYSNYAYASGSSGIAIGGAIAIANASGTIGSLSGDFSENYAMAIGTSSIARGGAVYNISANIGTLTSNFIANYTSGATSQGGAIYNASGAEITVSGSFINNYALSTGDSALGGAVYNEGTVSFDASSDMQFTGNYVQTATTTSSNAIYNTGTVNFDANSYKITVNDGINGYSDWTSTYGYMNINSGTVAFNNSVSGQYIKVSSGATLQLGTYNGVSASIDSYLELGSGSTLSIAISEASATIDMNTTCITSEFSGVNSALDLSDIFGDFSLTIEFSSDDTNSAYSGEAFYAFLNSDLDVIFAETTISDIAGSIDVDNANLTVYTIEDGEGTLLAEFSIAYDADSYDIIITGINYASPAVPEPSTYALILGLISLSVVYYRRRK